MALFGLFGPPNVEKLKAKRDIPGLIKTLRYENEKLKYSAMKTLVEIGTAAVEPLLAWLVEDWSAVQAAARALGQIDPNWRKTKGAQAAIPSLIAKLTDREDHVRKRAVEALGQIGDARAVGPLVMRLTDEYYEVRAAAVQVLEQIDPNWRQSEGARAVVPSLVTRLADNEDRKSGRDEAAWALEQIGDARAVIPFVKLAADRDWANIAIRALYSVIERDPGGVKADDLQAVARLDSVVQVHYKTDGCGSPIIVDMGKVVARLERVDCSQIRQLARQELIRRGLSA